MSNSPIKKARRRPGSKNTFTTRSGNIIKIHRGILDRFRAGKDAKSRRRAAYMGGLPKNKFKRILYRMQPKRLAAYWFSRDGALMALKITGVAIVVFFILIVGLFAYFRKDLPEINDISGDQLGGNITYYDRTGETVLWQDYDAIKRIAVPGDQISDFMRDATIAIEDKNFYEHGAFDIGGITRAALNNVFSRDGQLEGGSTITQQLVKLNQDWTTDRSVARKVKELILAVELEREYSKEDILNGYLNIAPYGTIQYGVEVAARDYFHKSAKDLTLAESAFLAAIPKSPSLYSPYGPLYDPEDLTGRQQYIIDQMVELNMISDKEAEEAKAVDILAQVHPVTPKYDGIRAPYFVLAAKEQLEQKYGAETIQRGGWKVRTTLDMPKQELAERVVADGLTQVRNQGGNTAGFVAVDVETAQVIALVGGPGFDTEGYGQVNFARERIQPGSSFKPYDYASLIEHGDNVAAGSVLYDTRDPVPGYEGTCPYSPRDIGNGAVCPPGTSPYLYDYDFRFPGPVTLRYGLAASRNVPAVKAMLTVGVDKTIETAESMGLVSGYNCYELGDLNTEAQCFGSSAIGDGAMLRLDEHTNSFATFSRLGEYVPRTYILEITDAGGETIDKWERPKGKQTIGQDTAYILADILSDPNASYMSRKIQRSGDWHFAVKTGTTNDNKDGLMMGFSTKYAAGVWVGHNDRDEMRGFMETMTSPIWYSWMSEAHQGLEAKVWERPSNVQTVDAYVQRSHVGGSTIEPGPSQDLAPEGYEVPSGASGGQQTIDKVSNKLATSCTPELAKEERGGGNDNLFSVDIFVGANANRDDTDDVHNCNDAKPSVTLTAPPTCTTGQSCQFTVTVTRGTHELSSDRFPGTVSFFINGSQIDSKQVSASPSTLQFTHKFSSTGNKAVRVQIVDSVLYESSQTSDVKVSSGGGSGSGSGGGGSGGDDDDSEDSD